MKRLFKNMPLKATLGLFIVSSVTSLLLFISSNSDFAYLTFGLSCGLAIALWQLTRDAATQTDENIQNLLTQHAQLSDALEIMGDGFILFDKDQNVVVANESVRTLFKGMNASYTKGVSRKALTLAALAWFEDDKQKRLVEGYLNAIDRNMVTPRQDVQWELPNGNHILVNEHYTHDRGIVSIIHDITKQNYKQLQIEERSTLLKTVFDNVPIGISVYDNKHRLLRWNEKYLEIMEVSKESIYPGIHMADLLSANFHSYEGVGDDPEAFVESVMSNMAHTLHNKIERKTKTGRHVELIRTSLSDGGYICTFSDVTLAKSAQLMLQESEHRYRKMVELSPDAIFVQRDGLIIFANAASIKLLGLKDLHSLIGSHVRKFFPTDDHEKLGEHFGNSDHMAAGENISSTTTEIIKKDGARVNVEVEATALLYGDRPVMQLIARDISLQTKSQELLKNARDEAEFASQLKGTFLANMSHELRTPLNAVIGFSEIIKNEIFGDVGSPKYTEYAKDIHSSGIHLLDLINDILDFSKMESSIQNLSEQSLEIDTLVDDCLRLINPQREKSGILVSTQFPATLPSVIGDTKMLKQVLLNLLSNAIKFTPTGGTVSILSDIDSDGVLFVTVKDSGIGIKNEDISKALTPFVQIDSELSRKYQGTGLGLPLSKNLMELHGGDLSISSKFGEGTSVTITLPRDRVERTAA